MILIPVPVAGGQSWTDILTAIGTVAAAAAAVGIAVWSHWDTSKRIADERRVTREREQLAEAYLVQVVLGEKYLIVKDVPIERLSTAPNIYGEWTDALHLAVMAVNRGSFTITSVEAQFSYDGVSLEPPQGYQRLSGFGNVRPRLREGWSPSSERAMHGVLAPWDAGIRFESDEVSAERLNNPYPLVRWTDRWGRGGSTAAARSARCARMRRGCLSALCSCAGARRCVRRRASAGAPAVLYGSGGTLLMRSVSCWCKRRSS